MNIIDTISASFGARAGFSTGIMLRYMFIQTGIFVLSFFSVNAQDTTDVSSLLMLENAGTRVGLLPDVGGRIVYLSYEGSPNLLKSDPALWKEEEKERIVPSAAAGWKEYNGHIVWLGPQSEWWTRQDENLKRKESRAIWPPDPFLIYGKYKILEQSTKAVKIMGPSSLVSGIRLIKMIQVQDDGSVYFEVEAVNTRRLPVGWDLWLNTRVSGYNLTYVPVSSAGDVRVEARRNKQRDTVNYAVCKNYFYYLPIPPSGEITQRNSKAFITPSQNWLASFSDEHCLVIEFDLYPAEKTHPEQSIIEIYNSTSVKTDLMELEYHSPYKTLQPGESMKTWERWFIYKYNGKKDPNKQIRFLKRKDFSLQD